MTLVQPLHNSNLESNSNQYIWGRYRQRQSFWRLQV